MIFKLYLILLLLTFTSVISVNSWEKSAYSWTYSLTPYSVRFLTAHTVWEIGRIGYAGSQCHWEWTSKHSDLPTKLRWWEEQLLHLFDGVRDREQRKTVSTVPVLLSSRMYRDMDAHKPNVCLLQAESSAIESGTTRRETRVQTTASAWAQRPMTTSTQKQQNYDNFSIYQAIFSIC